MRVEEIRGLYLLAITHYLSFIWACPVAYADIVAVAIEMYGQAWAVSEMEMTVFEDCIWGQQEMEES